MRFNALTGLEDEGVGILGGTASGFKAIQKHNSLVGLELRFKAKVIGAREFGRF